MTMRPFPLQYEEATGNEDMLAATRAEPCDYDEEAGEVNIVVHMLNCTKRHTAAQRSLFNALLHRMDFWIQNSSLFPTFILGPHSCTILQKDNQCVVLFGEQHRYTTLSAPEECESFIPIHTAVSITNFLQQWLLRTAVQTDVFVEDYYKLTRSLQAPIGLQFATTFRTCLSSLSKPKSGCYYENVRFHGTDINRDNFDDERFFADVYAFMTPLARKCIQAAMGKTPPVACDPEELKLQWIRRINRFLPEDVSASKNISKYIRKEEGESEAAYALQKVKRNWNAARAVLSADDAYRMEAVLTQHWSGEMYNTFKLFLAEAEACARDPSRTTEEGDDLANDLEVIFYSILMDMYTLGRMLKSPSAEKNAIIFYGGAYHAEVYSEVFEELGYTVVRSYTKQLGSCIPASVLQDALEFTGAGLDVRAAFPEKPFMFYRALASAEEKLNLWLMVNELARLRDTRQRTPRYDMLRANAQVVAALQAWEAAAAGTQVKAKKRRASEVTNLTTLIGGYCSTKLGICT